MYDEGLVANVNYARHPIARVEGSGSSWIVLDSAVVVAVFDFLDKEKQYLEYFYFWYSHFIPQSLTQQKFVPLKKNLC